MGDVWRELRVSPTDDGGVAIVLSIVCGDRRIRICGLGSDMSVLDDVEKDADTTAKWLAATGRQ